MNCRNRRKINNCCDGLDEASPIYCFKSNPYSDGWYNDKTARYRITNGDAFELEPPYLSFNNEIWCFSYELYYEDE